MRVSKKQFDGQLAASSCILLNPKSDRHNFTIQLPNIQLWPMFSALCFTAICTFPIPAKAWPIFTTTGNFGITICNKTITQVQLQFVRIYRQKWIISSLSDARTKILAFWHWVFFTIFTVPARLSSFRSLYLRFRFTSWIIWHVKESNRVQ